jgi:hypothetical protein
MKMKRVRVEGFTIAKQPFVLVYRKARRNEVGSDTQWSNAASSALAN